MSEKTPKLSSRLREKPDAPFFVGYLPMPSQLKLFYWLLAIGLMVASAGLGYWLAGQQRSTGPATWNTAEVTTMRGVLSAHPYPVLHRFHPQNPQQIESVLLVRQGKHSAFEFAAEFAQQPVSITGYEIQRGGWTMLELPADNPIQQTNEVDAESIRELLAIKDLGEVVLKGEIVDSKCFLGVMKPGAGKIHKACAEVCLLGGIPPMLVAQNDANQKFGYLVARADGSSASRLLAKYAAEAVQVSGQLRQQGDLLYIALDDNGISRL